MTRRKWFAIVVAAIGMTGLIGCTGRGSLAAQQDATDALQSVVANPDAQNLLGALSDTTTAVTSGAAVPMRAVNAVGGGIFDRLACLRQCAQNLRQDLRDCLDPRTLDK